MQNELKRLETLLKDHDWSYVYSENHTTLVNGDNEVKEISRLTYELRNNGYGEQVQRLFSTYCPFS